MSSEPKARWSSFANGFEEIRIFRQTSAPLAELEELLEHGLMVVVVERARRELQSIHEIA